MVYGKIHADKLYRMGQIDGENVAFEAGETKVLELTDEVQDYVDNAHALELLDTADTLEELTDGDASQGEAEKKESDTQGSEGDADSSDGEQETDESDGQTYGERLRDVEGVGDARAEQIEEFAADEDEMVDFLKEGETDSLPTAVVESLKAEFL